MSGEIRVITLKCANCGSNLEITGDMTQFACGYCGAQQIVERRGGTVVLKMISEAIARVQAGTDKTAAELAIKRLSDELSKAEAKANGILTSSNSASTSYSAMGNKGCLLTAAFSALGLLAGLSCLPADEKGAGITLIVLAILVAIIGGLITRSLFASARRSREKANQSVAPIHSEIQALKGKLEKQREIVDS